MELARLFATVGFKVDTEGLKEFRKELLLVKADLKDAALSIGEFKNNVKGMVSELRSFQKLIDPRNLSKFSKEMQEHAKQFNTLQRALAWSTGHDAKNIEASISSIGRLNTAIQGRYKDVMEYSQAILHLSTSFEMLKQATSGISRFRQVPSSAISAGGAGWGGSRSGAGRSPGDNQYIGYWGRAEGWAKSPFAAFIRPMLPTGMGLFNAVAGGYAFKELVKTGQEMTALTLKMKAVSDDSKQFADNMAFTHKISQEMGLDIQQIRESWANIFVAGKGRVQIEDMKRIFVGFNKYYAAVHMSTEDQRLANLAIQQMFGKGKIQAQEARLQMGQRVTPFLRLLEEAGQKNIKGFTSLDDMMKKGMLKPELLADVADGLAKIADSGGAFAEAVNNMQAKQTRFKNGLKESAESIMKSGGLNEALGNLFVALAKLTPIIVPLIKAITHMLNTFINGAQAIWQVKEPLMWFTGALVALYLTHLVRTAGALKVAADMFIFYSRQAWLANAATVKFAARFAIFYALFEAFADLKKYFEGEDNWVHAWVLSFEIAYATLDTYINLMIVRWKQFVYELKNAPMDVAKGVAETAWNASTYPVKKIAGGVKWFWEEFTNTDMYKSPQGVRGQPAAQYNPMVPNSPMMLHIKVDKSTGGVEASLNGFTVKDGDTFDISKFTGGMGLYGR